MKKYFFIILILLFTINTSYAMNNEKLYRLVYKAKNDFAKNEIQKYCSKEDPGLEIDSDIADQIFFNHSCKCAIKAGNEINYLVAKNILNLCKLRF
tara:strand:+ start:201 stop:488 length:288 start_codon:yes stop_codon:yes gene_type:complete